MYVCGVNWPYRLCVLSKQVILGVCLCGELALQTLCPFKAGYTWCVYDDITNLIHHIVLIDRVTEKSLQTTRKSEK